MADERECRVTLHTLQGSRDACVSDKSPSFQAALNHELNGLVDVAVRAGSAGRWSEICDNLVWGICLFYIRTQ
jgi:hypothetical protein